MFGWIDMHGCLRIVGFLVYLYVFCICFMHLVGFFVYIFMYFHTCMAGNSLSSPALHNRSQIKKIKQATGRGKKTDNRRSSPSAQPRLSAMGRTSCSIPHQLPSFLLCDIHYSNQYRLAYYFNLSLFYLQPLDVKWYISIVSWKILIRGVQ